MALQEELQTYFWLCFDYDLWCKKRSFTLKIIIQIRGIQKLSLG